MTGPILLTGFGPFRDRAGTLIDPNPSGELAGALDGTRIAGRRVIGVRLPVTYSAVRQQIPELIARHRPAAAISLGAGPAKVCHCD